MRASIRVRLLFSHLAVIVLAMGLSGVLLISSLERYFLSAAEESLLAQARITAQALIPGAVAEGWAAEDLSATSNVLQQQQMSRNISVQTENLALPESPELSDLDLGYLAESSPQLGAQLETRIRVLDKEGRVVVDSAQEDPPRDLSGDPLVAQALAGQVAARTGGDETMTLALPALVDGKLVGVIYLSQPLRDVILVMRDLRTRWIVSTAAALLLSGAVGLLLSGAITRPLRRLTAAAGTVAQGDFETEVPVGSRDELGRLSRAFNDMTARLRAARQMQTDFVANVSHELRTPLTSIKGMLETLRDGAVDDPEVRDRFLKTAEDETNRLIRLVNDLLILTRADSEALNLHRESVDLARLVRASVDRMLPQADLREVTLSVSGERHPPSVWADPDRIAQVFVNLLDNAIKYSRPGGSVVVRLGAGNGCARVRIEDEGIGIPAADLPHVGQRFYRADKARSRARGGSGLGLAIAHALVAAHGGEMALESREGAGTTVSFTLPTAGPE